MAPVPTVAGVMLAIRGCTNVVAGKHVAEQTHGKRDEAQEGREQLDDPHDDRDGRGKSRRGKALDVAKDALLLHAHHDEVAEAHERDGARDARGARSRLPCGEHADVVAKHDHEEHRGEEREVLLPRVAQGTLADVVSHKVDEILDAVGKEAVRHERTFHLALVGKEDGEHDQARQQEIERGDGEAHRSVSKDGCRKEALYELAHGVGDLLKRIAHETNLPFNFKTDHMAVCRVPSWSLAGWQFRAKNA